VILRPGLGRRRNENRSLRPKGASTCSRRRVRDLDHVARRLIESCCHSPDDLVFGPIAEVRTVEIRQVVVLDTVLGRASGQMVQYRLINGARKY
jgi:hypothetical protein